MPVHSGMNIHELVQDIYLLFGQLSAGEGMFEEKNE